jgi:DNA-binding CsgD family transcriptional regulator
MKKHITLLFVLFSIFKALPFFAQPSIIVSPNKDLLGNLNVSKEQQLERYLEEIEQHMHTDTALAITTLNTAIKWSRDIKNKSYESILESAYSSVLVKEGKVVGAAASLHQRAAMQLAIQSKDNRALAYAYLEKGRSESIEKKLDTAIVSHLKAIDFALQTNDQHAQTICYYYTGQVYKLISDLNNLLKMANLCFQKATNGSRKNSDIAAAYYIKALAAYTIYLADTSLAKVNFDSSYYYYKKCIEYTNYKDVYRKKYLAEANYNIGVLYHVSGKGKLMDSVLHYLTMASSFADQYKHSGIAIMSRLLHMDYLMRNNKLKEAETVLNEIKPYYATFKDNYKDNYKVLSSYELYNAKILESQGKTAAALDAYKNYITSSEKLYDLEKNNTVKKAEAQYINKTKAAELVQAQKDRITQRNQKYLAFALAAITLFGLLYMYRSYYFKQKALVKAKEEAILRAKLQEEENITIMLEAELVDKERLVAIQDKLLTEQQKDKLQQELMTNSLQLEKKNEILSELRLQLSQLKLNGQQTEVKILSQTLNKSLEVDEEFELLKTSLHDTNPQFFASLQKKANDALTKLDLKYCGYIKLGMGTREIANLMNIEAKSLYMARYRIKQKLHLEKEQDLDTFIVKV